MRFPQWWKRGKVSTPKIFKPFPQFETERLLLREINSSDAKDLFRFLSNAEVMKTTDLTTHSTIQDSKKFIDSLKKGCKKEKSIWWGITLKDRNEIIGLLGFSMWVKKQFCARTGSVLSKEFWNQGIMTEAKVPMHSFGFNKMGLNRIESVVMLHNPSAMKSLIKLGFQEEGILREGSFFKGQFHDVKLLSLLKKDFLEFSTSPPLVPKPEKQ